MDFGSFDYAGLSKEAIGPHAVAAGMDEFCRLRDAGLTSGNDFYLEFGSLYQLGGRGDTIFLPLGQKGIGNYGPRVEQVCCATGKVGTVVTFRMDSDVAFRTHPDHEFFTAGHKARGWPGGVYAKLALPIEGLQKPLTWELAAAGSGDHAFIARAAARATIARAELLWSMGEALRARARQRFLAKERP